MSDSVRLTVEVSPGEAFDKLSILAIKAARLADPQKLGHVRRETETLAASVAPLIAAHQAALAPLLDGLAEVNLRLWDVEDALRLHERRGDFGEEFIRLARAVYHTNDRRAALKLEINTLLGSDIAEQKSYAA
jgi:hypothetical protein